MEGQKRDGAPNYRMRAEFRVWHDGDDLYYIMFDKETREKYRVDQFPAASRLINRLMPLLIETIKINPVLRRKLFQIDFLSTLSGEILVSLLYHRKLDDTWTQEAQKMITELQNSYRIGEYSGFGKLISKIEGIKYFPKNYVFVQELRRNAYQ